MDLLLDGGNFHNLVIEHYSELFAHMRAGKVGKTASALSGQGEVDVGSAVLITSGIGAAQVASTHRGRPADQPVLIASIVLSTHAEAAALHQHRIGRKHAVVGLHRR